MLVMWGVAKPLLLNNRRTARASGTRRVATDSRAAAGKKALDFDTNYWCNNIVTPVPEVTAKSSLPSPLKSPKATALVSASPKLL
jgi:hypothetical protein